MYFCKRFLGLVLTGLFVASLFASANGPKELNKYNKLESQPTKTKVLVKTVPKADKTYTRLLPDTGAQSDSRDCTDCEFDFTPYGSECCDSAWDEFGINCADLEANYNWDCSGCLCPGDEEGECGDGVCNINEDCETCEADCGVCGDCDAGFVADCADNDCCPESWIGDGFTDCEDQQYGCDLTCYDNDGGDCDGGTTDGTTGTTTTGGDECSEGFCAEGTYWDGFSCWDCSYCVETSDDSACEDPYDCCGMCGGSADGACGDPVCGDGYCNGDETWETCPEDCNAPGECDDGFVSDCVDDDCCPESWIGDGFEDCEDQAFGCDLTCYDNDGGDCPEACPDFTCWDGSCVTDLADCPDEPVIENPTGVCIQGDNLYGYAAVTVSWDINTVCGDGVCNGDETYDTCPEDCPASCEDQGLVTCSDGSCAVTEDDCPEGASCDDCELDFTAYGSECCDTAWDEFGINCADLEANYNWDCSGCNCPGDIPCEDQGLITCWDGSCAETEADCPTFGECDPGYVVDCDGTGECWPESWIGDGFADCEDQQYGADLTCYDCDGGDCPDSDPGCGGDGTTTTGGGTGDCDACEFDFTNYGSECCDTAWDEFGIDCATLEANYSWDCSGCECPGDGGGFTSDNDDRSETRQLAATTLKVKEAKAIYRPATVSINDMKLAPGSRDLVAIVALSCDACLAGEPWAGSWEVDAMAFGYFTVYGFDPGSDIYGSVTHCEGASCSDIIDVGPAVAGDETSIDCTEGGGDPCDGQAAGDANNDGLLNVLDVVSIVNYILAGGNGLDDCSAGAADYNLDGMVNVLDVVAIVNLILDGGGRAADATNATMNTTENGVNISANGYIGGVQITLSHDADFSIELTDDAYIAEYKTDGNTTTLIVINPENEVIFTSTGDFTVEEVLVTNSDEFINVTEGNLEFSLSNAYPNPFNPTTTIELSLAEASYASVKVFNLKGEVVGVLMDGMVDASTYTITWDASNLSSGVYMIRAEANGQIATQKVMLVK